MGSFIHQVRVIPFGAVLPVIIRVRLGTYATQRDMAGKLVALLWPACACMRIAQSTLTPWGGSCGSDAIGKLLNLAPDSLVIGEIYRSTVWSLLARDERVKYGPRDTIIAYASPRGGVVAAHSTSTHSPTTWLCPTTHCPCLNSWQLPVPAAQYVINGGAMFGISDAGSVSTINRYSVTPQPWFVTQLVTTVPRPTSAVSAYAASEARIVGTPMLVAVRCTAQKQESVLEPTPVDVAELTMPTGAQVYAAAEAALKRHFPAGNMPVRMLQHW